MTRHSRYLLAIIFFGLLLPHRSYAATEGDDNKATLSQLIITQALLITLEKGLAWYTKEEHTCPTPSLEKKQPCPLLFFRSLSQASKTYIENLKKLHAMQPDSPEVVLLLHNGITIHQKIQRILKEVESMTTKQREQLRLVQEQSFSKRDLTILALLKEREYEDIPQDLLWQAKRNEYVSDPRHPYIFISKEFLQKGHQ